MSGGSYNYIYSKLSVECEGEMHDAEMDDLIKDLCEVLHDLEWWQSGDYSEDQYRETVSVFKKKWFKGERKMKDYESLVIESDDKNDWYAIMNTCSKCNTDFMCSSPNFCPNCGRKIIGRKKGNEVLYYWKGDEDGIHET